MPSYQTPTQTTGAPPAQTQPAPTQQQPQPAVHDGWMSYYGYTPPAPTPVTTMARAMAPAASRLPPRAVPG